MPDATPSQLGRYEVQAVLGKGSMGVVYLARDPLIGRLVALKTFHPNLAGEDDELERFRLRFLREAQSAGILSHPNIVTVHDVVESDGATFIAMEYVQGTNLKEVLRYGKPLEMGEVVDVVRQMAAALDYAHDRGVVHRDVKPANVLLTPERQVKLTDFGIARFEASNLTHEGQLLGTPNYMSPEQVQGREVDHKTDLFSLGVILYEALTRHKPFAADNLTAVSHRIVYDAYTPLDRYVGGLPEGLTRILDRALHKDPELRYEDAGELARDLEREIARHSEQVALSETRSIGDVPRLSGPAGAGGRAAGEATWPGSGSGSSSGLGTGPPPPPPLPGAAPAGAGGGAPASGAGRAVALPAGAGGRAAPLGSTGGGGGFRSWLRLEPGFGRPDWKRLSLVGLIVALAVLGIGFWLLDVVEPDLEAVAEISTEDRINVEFQNFLREGYRHNQEGDPAAAAAAFRRAEALKPNDGRVQRLRRVAEQHASALQMDELRQRQVSVQLEAAREALAAGRFQEALSTAGIVLESEPDNAEATEVARRARGALARQAQAEVEDEAAEAGALDEAAEAEEVAAGPSSLWIELETEGEGRLRVEVDGRLVADVGYEYFEKGGLFRRRKTYRGLTKIPGIEVEAGIHRVRYQVLPAEGEAQGETLEAEFPGGEARTLRLVHHPGRAMVSVIE